MLILLDLDGVLADFNGGACEVHNKPLYVPEKWDYFTDWGMTSDEFWKPIEDAGHCFYTNKVRPYPWAADLLRLVRQYGDFVIATANPLHPGLAASKTEWIRRYVGDNAQVMMGNRKDLLAAPGRVLIDDNDENVRKFVAGGGHGIRFPQLWNEARDLVDYRILSVKECLSHWKAVAA